MTIKEKSDFKSWQRRVMHNSRNVATGGSDGRMECVTSEQLMTRYIPAVKNEMLREELFELLRKESPVGLHAVHKIAWDDQLS